MYVVLTECAKVTNAQHLEAAARLCGFPIEELEKTLTVLT